jgi:hypothetical protein
MFDKLLFDRNAFDRSVSSEGLSLTMLGSGQVGLRLTVKTPIGSNQSGVGSLTPNIRMRQRITQTFAGNGNINAVTMILRRSTVAPLSGQGALIPNFTIRTPIAAALSGHGGMAVNSQMFLRQYMTGVLSGGSGLTLPIVMGTAMIGHLQGSGGMSTKTILNLPLTILQQGQGAFVLRRLGALNENVITLINIDFQPGDTITIDTDLLQVLFGPTEDVSSITSDSVFFELNPGENEITIDMDSNNTLDVIAIWQNRWL